MKEDRSTTQNLEDAEEHRDTRMHFMFRVGTIKEKKLFTFSNVGIAQPKRLIKRKQGALKEKKQNISLTLQTRNDPRSETAGKAELKCFPTNPGKRMQEILRGSFAKCVMNLNLVGNLTALSRCEAERWRFGRGCFQHVRGVARWRWIGSLKSGRREATQKRV